MTISLKERLLSDMKEAMKEKDTLRKNTIQCVRGAILLKEKEGHGEVSEDDILDMIMQEIKKRKDAIGDFEKGNRPDLVDDAKAEISVLESYLPAQMNDEELTTLIQQVIAECGATSMKDMGKVMGTITPKVKGKADNGKVSSIVKKCLS